MFIDTKTGKATLKQSERVLLYNAKLLLDQIAKFAACEDAKDAAASITATLATIDAGDVA